MYLGHGNTNQRFAREADSDTEVVCFLKLPSFYTKLKRLLAPTIQILASFERAKNQGRAIMSVALSLRPKGTNDINDRKSLTENEVYKIKCAVKHFESVRS